MSGVGAKIVRSMSPQIGDGRFRFGILQPEELAERLRALAAEIESGTIMVQNVTHSTLATLDEFNKEVITFEFVEAEKP